MEIYIFDLDDTLLPSNSYNKYSDIKTDIKIFHLFQYLYNNNNPIFIYTNGTLDHALTSLTNMNIIHYVEGIFARDNIPYMKPSVDSFKFVNNIIRNKYPNSNILFFDDMINNCKTALLFNWESILINQNRNNYNYGYSISYDNIYQAFNI